MNKLHILSTDKPSRLFDDGIKLYLGELKDRKGHPVTSYNLYITSDEEIKEGDWFITKREVFKCTLSDEFIWRNNFDKFPCMKIDCKKIILTTDQDLIKDGVQSIDDEFLEWFVKNPSCENVEVEKQKEILGEVAGTTYIDFNYKIIILKEEPKQVWEQIIETCGGKEEFMKSAGLLPKQETLEEFVFKVPFDYNIKPKEVIDMCMKEQENIILTWRLGYFIDMINSLPDDEKNRILKSVFDNRDGELLLESYKSMKKHYEK
jgi:hypothetical protein